MLFLAYIAPLLVFSVASRRKIPESIRKLIKILYSFSFLFGVQGVLRLILLPKFNFGELFQILGSSIYSTVQSITFTGTSDTQGTLAGGGSYFFSGSGHSDI